MWRLAIFKMINWAHEVERKELILDYLLHSRNAFATMLIEKGHNPINNFSFSQFIVAQAVEYGGAVSFSVNLRTRDDYTNFFVEYYDFVRVLSEGFPSLIQYVDETMAHHHSYMGMS